MNKEKEFVPYNLTLELHKLGIILDYTFDYYNTIDRKFVHPVVKKGQKHHRKAILWQQAFDWFRTQKDLHCVIYDVFDENEKLVWDFDIIDNNSEEKEYDIPLSETYEEARLKCLTKLIEIAK